MDADADRDEEGQGEAGRAARAPEPGREDGHAEKADRDAEQDEPRASETGWQRRLLLECLGERLDAEEREQAARERHERRRPAAVRAAERR